MAAISVHALAGALLGIVKGRHATGTRRLAASRPRTACAPLPQSRPRTFTPGTMVWEAHISQMKKTAFSMHVNLRHVVAEFM